MKSEYKFQGNGKINLNKTIIGILILINFLILSAGVYAEPVIDDGPYISPTPPIYTNDTIKINWTTDENSDSSIYYSSDGNTRTYITVGTGTTTHSVTFGPLATGSYNSKISLCNSSNSTDCANYTGPSFTVLTVPDTTPPSITTGPTTNPSSPDVTNEITILWGTNENATSTVHYQDNSGSWTTNTNSQKTTSHSVNIGTHTKGTFKYWVESCDESDNCANSGNQTVDVKFYNVSISSNATTGSGKPNDILTFRIDVTNTGNLQETFDIDVSYHDCTASLSASTLTIPASIPYDHGFSYLTVTLPSAASCKVNVTATSQKDTSVKATVSISLTVSQSYGVDITSANTNQTGGLGQNVTYTLRVKNIGNLNDRYDIYFSPTPSLLPVLSKKIVNCSDYNGCPPTGYEDITVTVTLPSSGVLSGATYTANVTARSKEDSNFKDSILLTTTVGSSYNFSLSCSNPSSCKNSGGAGSVLYYTLRLDNLGNINDNYTLTATANGGTVSIPNNVTVNAFGSQTFSLNFSIPSGTPQGTMFNINVTATSQGNGNVKIINLTANTTGVANGIITSFSAPANATLGDSISLNITFKNTGSVTVNAIPMVLVRDSSGNTVITVNGSSQSQNISSNGTHNFSLSWTVANLTPGRYYWLSPQVYYGGSEQAIYTPSEFYLLKSAELNVTPANITRTISPNVEEAVAVTITNTGNFGVISNVTVDFYNPSNLNVSITSASNFASINPGETKTVNMIMKSGSAGIGTGNLKILYRINGVNYEKTVPFNISVVSRPILNLNPAEIIYINSAGTTSDVLSAEVINTGDTSAYNVVAKVTGLSTVNMNVTCNSTIYAITSGLNKGNLTYTISIPGTAQGDFTGYLEIEYYNNVSGGVKYTSVFDVKIIVTKNYSSMYVHPTSITIERMGSSTPVEQVIKIINDGNETLTSIQLTPNVPGVTIIISPSSISSISVGGSRDVTARVYIPTTAGTYPGNITVTANAGGTALNQTIPVTIVSNHCGDGVCNYGETCDDCSGDCGICPDEGGRATHRLNLKSVKDYTAKLGETVKINVTIDNAGRRDETNVKLFIVNCPAKWTCETITGISIKRAKSVTLSLKITVPTTAELKKYPLTVKVDNKDEDTKIFNIIVGSQCSKDADCKSSEYCNKNVCGPKKGIKESCTRSDGSECESGICSGGVCIECESESDCGSSEYCSYGECLSKKGTSESCNENYECVLGSCVGGKCIECSTNKDCGSGWYCDDGKCLKLKKLGESCTNNADCATERCKDNKCACVSDSHCSEGEYCDNGECKTKVVEKLTFNIAVSPENITVGDNVTLRITSGGAPVSGAEVSVGGNIYTSDDNGEVVFPVNENGTLSVVVSKSGYNELSTEIFVSEKKEFQLNLGAMLLGLLLLLVILVVIILFLFSRKKGGEKEKSLQTLRGFRERFNYTSHEIKEKIKEMTSKEEKKEKEGETKKGTGEERIGGVVKEKAEVKEEVKEKPKGKPADEDHELLSIEDITLPSIGEVVNEGQEKAAPERKQEDVKPREEEEHETEKETEVKEEEKKEREKKEQQKKEEREKKEQQKKEEESTPWGDLLKEK